MKNFAWIFLAVLTLAWAAAGCGPGIKVDTNKLEQAFASAPGKADVSAASASIKSGDYANAVKSLEKVVQAGGLSQEQKDAISAAIASMQMIASQNPDKYPVEVYHAMGNLIDTMEGRAPAPPK